MIHTAVSRDSTSFNTGTTSFLITPSHLDHILVRMQEVLDQRTHDGLESGEIQETQNPVDVSTL